MYTFIRKRLVSSLLALFIVTLVVFVLARIQGDPRMLYIDEGMSAADFEAMGRELGLDRPIWEQYWRFIVDIATGDFGVSIHERRPVISIILERLPATLQLGLAAFAVSLLIGVPLGIVSAVHRGSPVDGAARLFAALGNSLPSFWIAIMAVYIFSVQLRVLPVFGSGTLAHYVLPALALGWAAAGGQARLVRSSMLEAMSSQYVVLARAKGAGHWRVILNHSLRNAILAPLTFAGLTLSGLITGTLIVETVFAWPGLGLLAINAVSSSDYPILQGVMIVVTLLYLGTSLAVDILYAFVDPRVRYD